MKTTKGLCLLLLIGGVGIGFTGCSTQAKLQSEAGITRDQAEKIALAKVPTGKIRKAELEREKGLLIWSLDVETPGSKEITEVEVDAKTGEIAAIENETSED